MLRIFKSKLFVLILITLSVLVFMGITGGQNKNLNGIGNIVSVPLTPVQNLISLIDGKIGGVLSYFRDMKAIQLENEDLKAEIDKLKNDNLELEEYKSKINDLKEALNLKDQLKEYDPIGTNIISKDPGNWFNVFRVDRGSKDGVVYNSPIITSKGLVGRITQTDALSSKAESIIDLNSVISGRLVRTRDLVRVLGDMSLKDQGLCRMDYIPIDVDIMVGDAIETSGIGGIYPKGIIIGKVKEVRKSSNELNKYAVIEPAVDFRRLEEVIILKNRTNIETAGSEGK
ncbi:MAG: mreC [Clostridiales bacterium]|nr:mreC [Clostridiales bacterium]